MKQFNVCVLGLLVAATLSAKADEFSLGAAALVVSNPYVGSKDQVAPVPVLGYEGEYGYFRGLSAGVYLLNDESHTLSINTYYLPLDFKPNDSDNNEIKQLNKRRSTLMAGIGYRYKNPVWGQLRFEISGDTLNNSNGILGDIGYLYGISIGDWRITPGIGVTWSNSNHNDYYYGIKNSESVRSGLMEYKAGSSWTPYVELSVNYRINDNWRAYFAARGMSLPNQVKNSPMVSDNMSGMLMTGISYVY